MKHRLPTALVLALAALPLAALADPGPAPRGPALARILDLTEPQKAAIRSIREKHLPDLAARREGVRLASLSLRRALQDPATPESQLRALHGTASAARLEAILASRAMRLEIAAVLTPEQRIKAAELRGAARERRRERSGLGG